MFKKIKTLRKENLELNKIVQDLKEENEQLRILLGMQQFKNNMLKRSIFN